MYMCVGNVVWIDFFFISNAFFFFFGVFWVCARAHACGEIACSWPGKEGGGTRRWSALRWWRRAWIRCWNRWGRRESWGLTSLRFGLTTWRTSPQANILIFSLNGLLSPLSLHAGANLSLNRSIECIKFPKASHDGAQSAPNILSSVLIFLLV